MLNRFIILIFLLLPVLAQAGVVSDTVKITAGEDDANCYYNLPTKTFDSTATWYYLGRSVNSYDHGGIRFLSVGVTQGTTIDSAFLILNGYRNCYISGSSMCRIIFYGEDVDNSAVFTTGSTPADRVKTTANKPDSSAVDDSPNGRPEYTWSVTSIIQEIVSREGWSSGNNLSILIEDNGSNGEGKLAVDWKWDTYESTIGWEPKLIVWWTEEEAGGNKAKERRKRLLQESAKR